MPLTFMHGLSRVSAVVIAVFGAVQLIAGVHGIVWS
jgi:hypothetical protein